MSAEKIREEYNAWYAEKIGVLGTHQHKEWFAPWSASRAAIEVDFTEVRKTTALPDRLWLLGNDAVAAIESLGLKVKP